MSGLATLPGIPDSALDGLPPAEDLPTIVDRRRYAQALACALAGERAYEIGVWPRESLPVFVARRAEQEGWPALGTATVVAIIQPAPLPDSPAELITRALAHAPEAFREAISEQITCLWLGEQPQAPSAEVMAFLGRAFFEAGVRAHEEALSLARAEAARRRAEGAG